MNVGQAKVRRNIEQREVRKAARRALVLHQLFWLAVGLVCVIALTDAQEARSLLHPYLRLEPAVPPSTSVIGLSEYLAALALLFVVLTVSDFRYRFRLSITALRSTTIGFAVSFGIGFFIIGIDAWFQNHWPIPSIFNNANNIKLLLAFIFLALTCHLSYVAFISPPRFTRWNSSQTFNALHQYIGRGNPDQLAVIADWLGSSAEQIVDVASRRTPDSASSGGPLPPTHADYAIWTLSLLGNKRLCQQIVDKSPWTLAELFRAFGRRPYAKLPISQFARNVGTELVVNPRSSLYAEDDGYTSGLLGFTKPVTTTVYGDATLVEALASAGGSPLDIDVSLSSELTATQLEAYARAVLIYASSYISSPYPHHSYAFTRALDVFEPGASLSNIAASTDHLWKSDEFQRLRVTVDFIKKLINLLERQETPRPRRQRKYRLDGLAHVHRQVAGLIFELIKATSRARASPDICWELQHNCIWSELFSWEASPSKRLVAFYLRRLMYDEIKRFPDHPNFVSAGIVGYCLNVLGITDNAQGRELEGFEPLQRAAVAWAKSNFIKLQAEYPAVAGAVLVGGLSFDAGQRRLVKTYAELLGKPGAQRFLELKA